MLIEYVRHPITGQRCGVVVAVDLKDGTGSIGVGWSACHHKKDTWNKDLGLTIAINRAYSGTVKQPLPHVQQVVDRMYDRAMKYYRTQKIYA
jgi:hypothetical protein